MLTEDCVFLLVLHVYYNGDYLKSAGLPVFGKAEEINIAREDPAAPSGMVSMSKFLTS
jgi:hypothetical protein